MNNFKNNSNLQKNPLHSVDKFKNKKIYSLINFKRPSIISFESPKSFVNHEYPKNKEISNFLKEFEDKPQFRCDNNIDVNPSVGLNFCEGQNLSTLQKFQPNAYVNHGMRCSTSTFNSSTNLNKFVLNSQNINFSNNLLDLPSTNIIPFQMTGQTSISMMSDLDAMDAIHYSQLDIWLVNQGRYATTIDPNNHNEALISSQHNFIKYRGERTLFFANDIYYKYKNLLSLCEICLSKNPKFICSVCINVFPHKRLICKSDACMIEHFNRHNVVHSSLSKMKPNPYKKFILKRKDYNAICLLRDKEFPDDILRKVVESILKK